MAILPLAMLEAAPAAQGRWRLLKNPTLPQVYLAWPAGGC